MYSTTDETSNTYLWTVTGGTIVGANNISTVVVDWGVAGAGTVRVTETNSITGCSTITPFYNVTKNPNPTPSITGSSPVCENQGGQVYSTPNVIGNTYAWSVVGGSISAGAGTNSITVTWGSAGSGSVQVTQTVTATGCSTVSPLFNVTINPGPAPVIGGPNSVCANQSGVVYSTPNIGGHTYSWIVTGGTIVGPSTNNSVTINWGIAGSGTLRVTETITATGCSTQTTDYPVTINPNPSPSISGPAAACANQAGLQYTTPSVSGNTYVWNVTGGTITAGAGTNTITVTWDAAGAGTVRVLQTVTATGCSTLSPAYDVTINPNPAPTISGPAAVCANQAGVVYSTPLVAGRTYSWVVTGGAIIGPAINNSVTVDWGAAGAGTVRVTETITATGCSTLSPVYNVTINPNPTPVISGPNVVCANQNGVAYSTPSTVGHTYAWTITGGTIASGAGTANITVNWGAAGTGTLRVTETITASGCSTLTPIFNVTKNPLPTGTVTGSTSVCQGASATYSTANIPDISYSWVVTGGGTILSGDGTPDIVVTWATTGAKQVRVIRTNTITGCSSTTPNLNVTVNPNPTPVISGVNSVCANQLNVTYSTPSAGGRTYSWNVTGGTIASGAGTATIQVNWGGSGVGLVELTETINATSCTTIATPLNVVINPNPTPVISGASSVCENTLGIVYSTPNVVGHTYSWSVTGGSIASGATSNAVTVNWGAAGVGTVTLTETITATGCSITTPAYPVTIDPKPTPVITGPNTVCANQSGVIYSTPANAGRSYSWTVTGGTIASGAGTASIQVNWGASGTGTVQLTETIDASSCSTIAAPLTVIINPVPTPVVSGTSTVCANQTGLVYSSPNTPGNIYIWSVLGGTIAGGAGTNSITVNWGSAGAGSVTLIEFIPTTGCVTTSAPLSVTINPNPTPFITGANTVCANTLGSVYSTPNVVGHTYSWVVTGGTINGSSTGNSIVVDWGATPGTGTVQLTETITASGCAVTTSLFNVTINTAPSPVISGLNAVCANQISEITIYSTPNTPGNFYNWSVLGGAIVGGIGTHEIYVQWGAPGIGEVAVTEFVTATGCAVSATPLTVTINPRPAPVISGNNFVCANDQDKVYSTPLIAGRSYAWVVTGGVIDGPSTGNSIVVDWGGAGTGTIELTETIIATGCSITTPVFTVNINPIPTPVIGGLTSVCANEAGVTYTTPNVPGNGYTWTVVGGSIVSGAGTSSITVNWGGAGVGSVTLTEFIPASSCSVTTPPYVVNINPIPTPVISGLNSVCANATNVVYSTPLVAGNTYSWSIAGGTIVGSSTDNTVTINWGSAGTGTLQLLETVGICSVTTPFYTVAINPNPTPVISGSNSVCSNQTGVVYTTPNVIGNSYLWEVVGGSIVSGSGTSTIQVTWAGSGVGSVTLTETITATGCAITTAPLLVTISPSASVNAGSDAEICQGSTFNFTSQVTPATASDFSSLLWTTTGTGTLSNQTTLTPTYVPGVGEFGLVTFTLTATATGACPTVDDQMILTITPTPVVDAGSDVEICQGSLFPFSSQTTGASAANFSSLAWSHTGTGTLFNSTTLTPTYLPGPAETGLVTFTLQANSTGSCGAVTDVMVLTITPSVTVSAGSNAETCAGVTFNFASQSTPATATNFQSLLWTTTGSGTLVNETTLTPSYTPAVSDLGSITFTLTAVGNGSCPTVQSQMQLAITPAPVVSAGSNQEICEGLTFNFNTQSSPATASNFSSITWTTNGTGTIFNGNTLTPTYVPSPGETGTLTFTLTATGNGSCVPVNSTMNLVITPRPLIHAGGDAEVCQTTSFNFGTRAVPASGSNFFSLTWTTTGTGTLFNANTLTPTYTPGVGEFGLITFTLTATGNGSCTSVQDQMNLTVTPSPVVDAGSTESICQGSIFSFASQSTLASATHFSSILWTTTGTGTLFNANTLTPIYQPTTGETGTLTFTLTANAAGTCTAVNDVMQLIITPSAIINAGTDAETCEGVAFDFATQFIPAFGINYSSLLWTSTGTGTIAGANTLSPVYTPGVGETGLVTFTLTAFGNGVCPSVQDQMVLSITPGIIVDAGSNEEICQGATFSFASQSVGASASNIASVFWSHTGSGSLFNANTLAPTYFASPSETGLVTFTLTAFSAGSCSSINDAMQLTITPAPVSIAGSNDAVCQGTPTFDFASRSITASIANGTLVWSHNGTGSLNDPTVLNPVYTVGAGDVNNIVTFTLTVTSPSAVCAVAASTFQLRVNPQALVFVPSTTVDVCEPTSIPLTGTVGGSANAGSWSLITGDGTLSTSSITGLTVGASYTTALTDVGNTVTFRLTTNDPDGAGPCVPAFIDVDFTVDESAKVNAGVDFAICEYDDIILNGSFSGSTTSVTWTGGTNNFDIATNPITGYSLSAAERAATNLSITFTLTTNDPPGVCPAVSDQVVVAVRDTLNFVTIVGLDPVYAENSDPVNISGVPGGGVFSGPGISGNTFFPSIANLIPAMNIITYTYQDPVTGCFSSPNKQVIVNPITDVNFRVQNEQVDPLGLANGYICANQGDLVLIEDPLVVIPNLTPPEEALFTSPDLPPGRIYFDGSGVPANQKFKLRTDGLAPGLYTIVYTFTNSFGAPNPVARIIRVTAGPKAIIDVTNSCITSDITFTESSFIPGTNPYGATISNYLWEFGDGNGSTQQEPTYQYNTPLQYDVKLRVTTNEGCFRDTLKTIRVGPVPLMAFNWSEFCNGNDTKFVDNSNPGISTIDFYTWEFNDGFTVSGPAGSPIPGGTNGGRTTGTFTNPNHRYDNFGQYDVRLTVETNDGCTNDLVRRVFIQSYGTPSPTTGYFEDFELSAGTWVATKANNGTQVADLIITENSWVWTTPSGLIINSASGGSINAWWTGLNPGSSTTNSTYYNTEKSAVIGPCLNLSNIERPMVSVDYWADLEDQRDGAVLQYSVDGGVNWFAVGDISGAGLNWYNRGALVGNPGLQNIGQFGWTGIQNNWKTARFNLDMIDPADRDEVIFRIAFGSDENNGTPTRPYEGFAFDNIFIGEKQREVLVEYFTNAGINPAANNYLNNLYFTQTDVSLPGPPFAKKKSDFFKIQYHIANPLSDVLNQNNPVDPASRSLFYGVSQPPAAIMDGILGNYYGTVFNGDQAKITAREADKRALEDPLFRISLTQNAIPTDSISALLSFEYIGTGTFNSPVTFQLALVDSIVGTGPNANIHVLRKLLLGTEGLTVSTAWSTGTSQSVPVKSIIDVPVANGNNLWLVAFVQDRTTKRIHQSYVVRSLPKTTSTVVGLGDDPVLAQIRDIIVFPNPASKNVNFALENGFNQLAKAEGYTWSIVDQRGIIVQRGELQEDLTYPQEVAIDRLANGMYIIIFNKSDRIVTQRKLAVMNSH
ncbi:MAG: PKD domain-containing protein [Cyclobacteriaceae bacterium]|nr:PKD domain-containing protein [Cyclobacteriaceae bacterium]